MSFFPLILHVSVLFWGEQGEETIIFAKDRLQKMNGSSVQRGVAGHVIFPQAFFHS